MKLLYDDSTDQYSPANAINPTDAESIGKIYDSKSESKHAVTSVHYRNSTQDLFVGGNFKKFNNIFRFSEAFGDSNDSNGVVKSSSRLSLIPNKQSSPTYDEYIEAFGPDAPFSDCMKSNAKKHDGVLDMSGAGFCCRVGSYCPKYMIDIPCPLGWGYFCKGDRLPDACPEEFYCANPGRKILCPKGDVCALGSDEPRKCEFWELCGEEGLKAPARMSGIVLAAIVLGILFVILITGIRIQHSLMMKGRRHLELVFNQRFNAFTRQVRAPLKILRRSMSGVGENGIDDHNDEEEEEEEVRGQPTCWPDSNQ